MQHATLGITALSNENSAACGINDTGQVVGYETSRGNVVWDGDQMTELGGLPDSWTTDASAINDAGQVVGSSGRFPYGMHAVRWENGQITTLGELGRGGSHAFAINDAGQVVGTSGEFHDPQAVIWDGGRVTALGDTGDINFQSYAFGINENRQVVEARAVNNAKQVVGWATSARDRHAVLWENGAITVLGTLPGHSSSEALAINDRGQIVGISAITIGGEEQRAVRWQRG